MFFFAKPIKFTVRIHNILHVPDFILNLYHVYE